MESNAQDNTTASSSISQGDISKAYYTPYKFNFEEETDLINLENQIKQNQCIKDEILSNIQSITQLGRSAGIHCILCTQRNDATILPGVIQNNPLSIDTLVEVKEPFVDKVRAKINKLFRRDAA